MYCKNPLLRVSCTPRNRHTELEKMTNQLKFWINLSRDLGFVHVIQTHEKLWLIDFRNLNSQNAAKIHIRINPVVIDPEEIC